MSSGPHVINGSEADWHPFLKGIVWCVDEELWSEYTRYLNEQMI